MTLRHIVSWKLSGETRAERDAQAAEMTAALETLPGKVPSLRSLSVHRNELHEGENWDLMLITDFDDEDGLAEYAAHPEHVAVAAVTKGNTAGRVALDFHV